MSFVLWSPMLRLEIHVEHGYLVHSKPSDGYRGDDYCFGIVNNSVLYILYRWHKAHTSSVVVREKSSRARGSSRTSLQVLVLSSSLMSSSKTLQSKTIQSSLFSSSSSCRKLEILRELCRHFAISITPFDSAARSALAHTIALSVVTNRPVTKKPRASVCQLHSIRSSHTCISYRPINKNTCVPISWICRKHSGSRDEGFKAIYAKLRKNEI